MSVNALFRAASATCRESAGVLAAADVVLAASGWTVYDTWPAIWPSPTTKLSRLDATRIAKVPTVQIAVHLPDRALPDLLGHSPLDHGSLTLTIRRSRNPSI